MTKKTNKNKEKDVQSRSWQITLNNPEEKGFNRETFKETILKLNPIYFCISEEIGLKGTLHYHCYFKCPNNRPQRFSRISKLFNKQVHIEKALGSATDNRNYLLKIDKWEKIEKKETLIDFEEWGEIPTSIKEKHKNEKEKLLEDIKAGKSNIEIIEENPMFAFRIREIDTIRNNYQMEKNSKSFRSIHTYFLFGDTATGRTSFVYNNFPTKDIFRIYNYHNLNSLWDGYNGEKVVLMDEFKGQIPIELMLILTDKFPITGGLSRRYNNAIPNFEYLFIATNSKYEDMYSYEKAMRTSTWMAFDRRWQNIWEFKKSTEKGYEIIKHRETKFEEENKDE